MLPAVRVQRCLAHGARARRLQGNPALWRLMAVAGPGADADLGRESAAGAAPTRLVGRAGPSPATLRSSSPVRRAWPRCWSERAVAANSQHTLPALGAADRPSSSVAPLLTGDKGASAEGGYWRPGDAPGSAPCGNSSGRPRIGDTCGHTGSGPTWSHAGIGPAGGENGVCDRGGGSSSSSSSSSSRGEAPRGYVQVLGTPTAGRSVDGIGFGGKNAYLQVRCASSRSAPSGRTGSDLQHYMHRGTKLAGKVGHRIWETCKRIAKATKSLTLAFLRDPRIVKEWYGDIRDAVVHFCRWVATGFRLFGADLRASFFLTKRVLHGYPLTVRQRNLLVRTTSDCLKLIPFSFFIVVPFAEIALPVFLRIFPGMMPSTFFEQKYDNATLARKLKAKEEMAEFWQQVVLERTKEISEADNEFADKAEELQKFQEKLMDGQEFPRLKEILSFSKLFQEELSLQNMSPKQLSAMSRMLGLPQSNSWWPGHLQVQLRHHITNLRREDRDYLWEGIDGLTQKELIEACRKRAIRFHEVTEAEMRRDLIRWLELSANHRNIPTSLLLWIQSFYLRAPDSSPAECSDLQMDVKPSHSAQLEPEAKEAFHSMAERQRASLKTAQQKLEVLRHEIDEVIEHPDATSALAAGQGGALPSRGEDSPSEPGDGPGSTGVLLDDEQEEKQRVLQRLHELDGALHLYKEVVERQKELLDQQLRFLTSMRDNKPTKQKDADVILLDQRVRLLEMIGAFERSTGEIERLLGEGSVPGGERRQEAEEPWAWPPVEKRPSAQGPAP